MLVLLGWYLNELSVLLMIPKVLINWPELEETLEGEHYTQQVVAGQEEIEEKTVEEEHLEGEEAYGEEEDTREGVGQVQKQELLVVMGLEFSVIFRCGVVHGLYFWKNKFQDIKASETSELIFSTHNLFNPQTMEKNQLFK